MYHCLKGIVRVYVWTPPLILVVSIRGKHVHVNHVPTVLGGSINSSFMDGGSPVEKIPSKIKD